MSVKVSSLAATIEMLGASLSIDSTAGAVKVKGNCGTIALINQIISDLSSLRTTLRDAEKEMQTDLRLSIDRTDTGACNDINTPDLTGNKISRATKEHVAPTGSDYKSNLDATGIAAHWQDGNTAGTNFVTSGALLESERHGSNWPGRGADESGGTDNTGKVGIKLGSTDYIAEQAIMNVLVDVYGVVDKLKNGSSIVVANNYKASLE